jgi:hypothetical protein
MVEIQIQGIDQLAGYFLTRPEEMRTAIRRALTKSAFLLERNAKTSPYMRVDTGRMRASIGGGSFESKGNRPGGSFPSGEGIKITDWTATVGPTVEYAPFVHKKYPFMDDAAARSEEQIQEYFSDEIGKAIE